MPDVSVFVSQGLSIPSHEGRPAPAQCWVPWLSWARRAYLRYGEWMRMAGTASTAIDAFERSFIKGLISVAFAQAQEDPFLSVNM